MVSKRIYLSPPHMSDEGYEMDYIKEAFDTNWIAPLGPNVDSFEKEICDYVKIKSAVALSSGTAAVHLALRYLGIDQGDYVFCSNFTFIGSCNPIMYERAIPVFIGSEAESWNMSPLALEKAFHWAKKENKMPKAVIITDLYGQSADYEKLLPICNHYKIPVIEDSAEALGATYRNRKCGTFGYINIFSFNGNKIITTSGGGMAVSDDEDVIKKLRFWSTQAREPEIHYEHKEIGYNYRMSNICAGIGRGQLKVVDKRVKEKKRVRENYEEGLKDLPISFMPVFKKGSPNYWLTVITIEKGSIYTPKDIILALEKENIESRPVWKPMHMQSVFKDYHYYSDNEKYNLEENLFEEGVCLPSGSAMSIFEENKVIEIIINKLSNYKKI
jgi:pyridoxal phosphate-dependent aminotransferase EpsN